MTVQDFQVRPVSMVNHDNMQRIEISCKTPADCHLLFRVLKAGKTIRSCPVSLCSGQARAAVLLETVKQDTDVVWQLCDNENHIISQTEGLWKKPREWQLFVMISSHTDIGLHNPPYIQRFNSSKFIDEAAALCDKTNDRPSNARYRYVMEGTWFWNNYAADRGGKAALNIVENYIKKGKMGVCAGIAGNHTQTFGLEEMCRSTYGRNGLAKKWGIDVKTMAMIDNNGLSWGMVQPYAEAGYENIIFAPNQWNPLPSSVWKTNTGIEGYTWNPNACGGGSRIDIRYTSELPMVFYWQGADGGTKLLVWGSTQYGFGGSPFGLRRFDRTHDSICEVEDAMGGQLALMEHKVPYDVWLFEMYEDDQEPEMTLTDTIAEWNRRWKFPQLKTLGNPDEPFAILREKFNREIPVLKGDITGGWYQHPLSAPDLLAQKAEADRLLPTAEKLAVIAALTDKDYGYPQTAFNRAWACLLYNDEHSYGTSGYQGRRVYETWMQHKDWIHTAQKTAENECKNALNTIARHINCSEDAVVVFNPTLKTRTELVEHGGKKCIVSDIPPLGYKTVPKTDFVYEHAETAYETAPVLENSYYRLQFHERGSICSLYDKELKRELLDTKNRFGCNEFVYTGDNHRSFSVPQKARFKMIREYGKTTVESTVSDMHTEAEIVQRVSLYDAQKRIDIDNTLNHVRALYNTDRYYRYCYYAFPFMVENAKRYCHLNGCMAEYAVDITGHGTDVYMAANEWCCAENGEFGVALMQLDSELIEFDHIHPDKTDYLQAGSGSQIFSYIANDWLQMHTAGGSHINLRFRYSITSYSGGFKSAKIPVLAERFASPVRTAEIGKQSGGLFRTHSFMEADEKLRLLTLKRAEDGNGMIARFYTGAERVKPDVRIRMNGYGCQRVATDETPLKNAAGGGFLTYRLGSGSVVIKTREDTPAAGNPAPIGSVYTGLIASPAASRGENPGHLYLLWGASMEKDLSHYELYRSEKPGFAPGKDTLIAKVAPEQYRVARYEDTGLKEHTRYYYRVRAVNRSGAKSRFSDEFNGITKETID